MDCQNEYDAIKQYFEYLRNRIIYLEKSDNINSNEYKFYRSLRASMMEWGTTHKVCFKYLARRLTVSDGMKIIGVSERTFSRLMTLQRKDFIKFVTEQEKILEEKYPFIPEDLRIMLDLFNK